MSSDPPESPDRLFAGGVVRHYPGCLDVAVIDNQAFVGVRSGDVRVGDRRSLRPRAGILGFSEVCPPSYSFAASTCRGTCPGPCSGAVRIGCSWPVDGAGVPHFRDFRTTRSVSSGALTDTHVYLTSSPFLEAVTLECARPVAGFNWHQVGTHVSFDLQSGYGVTSTSWWYGDGLERHRGQPRGPRSSTYTSTIPRGSVRLRWKSRTSGGATVSLRRSSSHVSLACQRRPRDRAGRVTPQAGRRRSGNRWIMGAKVCTEFQRVSLKHPGPVGPVGNVTPDCLRNIVRL